MPIIMGSAMTMTRSMTMMEEIAMTMKMMMNGDECKREKGKHHKTRKFHYPFDQSFDAFV